MNIKFYLSTRKYKESHRYFLMRHTNNDRVFTSNYLRTLSNATYNHNNRRIKVDLPSISRNSEYRTLINNICYTITHESLHYAINSEKSSTGEEFIIMKITRHLGIQWN